MCRSKNDPAGPLQCEASKAGSQATCLMTEISTGAPKKFINKVMSILRREGKQMPDPSEEEILAFARNNQFLARHDSTIPDNMRGKLVKMWKKAETEKPTGAGFYAMKHTPVAVAKSWKRSIMASMAIGTIAISSACGAVPPKNNDGIPPQPTQTVTAPTNSPSLSASPTTNPEPTPSQTNNVSPEIEKLREKNKVVRENSTKALGANGVVITDKTVKAVKGDYPQLEISKNSKLVKFNPSTHEGGTPSGWSKQDMADAQRAGMNTVLQTILDSPVTNAGKNNAAEMSNWTKNNASRYSSDVSTNSPESLTIPHSWQDDEKRFKDIGYTYSYDGKTPRMASVNLTLNSSQTYDGGVYYSYSGSYSMNATTKSGKPVLEQNFVPNLGFTVKKENGKFLVAGIEFDVTVDKDALYKQATR